MPIRPENRKRYPIGMMLLNTTITRSREGTYQGNVEKQGRPLITVGKGGCGELIQRTAYHSVGRGAIMGCAYSTAPPEQNTEEDL